MFNSVKLSDGTFRQARDYIYSKCGIYIQDTKKYLIENRFQKRLQEKNLRSFEDYLYLLQYDSKEQEHLFNLITTRETSFFREPLLLEAFYKVLLPQVSSSKGGKPINIWSAGCSTGEEAYTLSIYLLEHGNGRSIAKILATDLSSDAITSAKRAVYGDYSLRNATPEFLKKYFTKTSGGLTVSLPVKRMVQFKEMNLTDDRGMRGVRGMDFIFCRNTMIYFDAAVKQKVVSFYYDSLNPGGYLFVGASESLHSVSRAFKPIAINKAVVYKKG